MDRILSLYSAAKSNLSAVTGASEDLLHLHAGLFIFFASALLFRRRMRSRVPIALVWGFALGNELIDYFTPASGPVTWEWAADFANTVVWPSLLFLLARRRGKAGAPDKTA